MLDLISNAFAADGSIPSTPPTGTGTQSPIAPEDMAAIVSPQKMMTDTLFFLVMLFGIFYFILIRPQQKRIATHKAMLGKLEKGTKVITGGGIIGTVSKLEGDDIVLVEIAPNVKVQVAKATIQEVMTAGAAKSANDN